MENDWGKSFPRNQGPPFPRACKLQRVSEGRMFPRSSRDSSPSRMPLSWYLRFDNTYETTE